MEKNIVDRRIQLLEEAGIEFMLNTEVPSSISCDQLLEKFDAILLCGGSSVPRDLEIPGRQFNGVHFAMEYLVQNNKNCTGESLEEEPLIEVEGQHVVVIGGGDTGSDCIGTSHRLGAISVSQIEIMPMPKLHRDEKNPWPLWPQILRVSSSQAEGCNREWSLLTEAFVSKDGVNVSGIKTVDIAWKKNKEGSYAFEKIPSSEKIIPCTKVFLAMGFLHPALDGMLELFDVALDNKNNVKTNNFKTNKSKIFSAGDMRRGQSLVVWAIKEGRDAAIEIDKFLMNNQSKLSQNAYQL